MAYPKSGEAVPTTVGEAADKSWWAFKRYNPGSAREPRMAYVIAYQRGYKDALADTAQFAGLQASVDRLSDLLEEGQLEREAVRMAEAERV
jgi:hypothetical protein